MRVRRVCSTVVFPGQPPHLLRSEVKWLTTSASLTLLTLLLSQLGDHNPVRYLCLIVIEAMTKNLQHTKDAKVSRPVSPPHPAS